MIAIWLRGLVKRRSGWLIGVVAGLALGVAILTDLGAFLASSAAGMTAKSIAALPIDWQIQLVNGADPATVLAAAGAAMPYDRHQTVLYADVDGFEAHSGGTVQTTGPGKAIGLALSYGQDFPGVMRPLLGVPSGVLLAQQTAANLHVGIGDRVTVQRPGAGPVELMVDGIVDLPNADSFFQTIGMPPGAAPQAPPDNVIFLPLTTWRALFDPQAAVRPDSTKAQIHLRLRRQTLPGDPGEAYLRIANAGRNLEARLAGSALLGNNLMVQLDAVRSDALYARVLFLFLGAPGALLAFMLSAAVVGSAAGQRRRDHALLRTRGVSDRRVIALVACETLFVTGLGIVAGFLLAALLSVAVLRMPLWSPGMWPWFAAAGAAGLVASAVTLLLPAWVDLRWRTTAASSRVVNRERFSFWRWAWLDASLLALAGLSFWRTQSSGYQIVLAPEGVPQSAVDYTAFVAPLALWLGIALVGARLLQLLLARGGRALSVAFRPFAGPIADLVAATMSRERSRLARNVLLLVIAVSFAASTAVFDTTYNAQSLVDAQLTNGADVTVTANQPVAGLAARLAAIPGIRAIQAMQHHYAYVGNDLQDLYGIDPAHIAEATAISDAYFKGANARAILQKLAATPDGVLVSEETVSDYQLSQGDLINLRLQSSADHQYHVVPFHFVGVVREFPTAPRDSFLVANAAYLATATGSGGSGIFLLRAAGDTAVLAAAVRQATANQPGLTISDLGASLRLIQSNLTSVNLSGLTKLELAFAILMAAGAAVVVFLLGIAERRRSLVILWALGTPRPLIDVFIWLEAAIVLSAGLVFGLAAGFGVAGMLVKLLTGVFDPPPDALTIPWAYLGILVASTAVAIAVTSGSVVLSARRSPIERLRSM